MIKTLRNFSTFGQNLIYVIMLALGPRFVETVSAEDNRPISPHVSKQDQASNDLRDAIDNERRKWMWLRDVMLATAAHNQSHVGDTDRLTFARGA